MFGIYKYGRLKTRHRKLELGNSQEIILVIANRVIRIRSVHVFTEFAAVKGMQSFGFVGQDVDEAVGQICHQPR